MRLFSSAILILIITSITNTYAQEGSISGFVTDNETKERIPYVNISVTDINEPSSIRGTTSDSDGNFHIGDLPSGKYNIILSFIGYQSDTIKNIEINNQNQQVIIGETELDVVTFMLDEVEVKDLAERRIAKLDRITYDVNDFETARGGTASDLLNKLPSVSIDQNGVISVRGTTDYMVYIDGKPTQIDTEIMLSQIKATDIESIDIITVPSARYDAQGKGGIINIATRKTSTKGISISASGLFGAAPWDNYTHQISNRYINDNRYSGGLNFIYSKNKLSLYSGLNFSEKNVNGTRGGFASLWQGNESYFHMVPVGPRIEWTQDFTANAAMDYQLQNKTIVSASLLFGKSTKKRSALYNYHTFTGDIDKYPLTGIPVDESWIYNPNEKMRYGNFYIANIDYIQKIGNNSDIKISALLEHSELRNEMDNRLYHLDAISETAGDIQTHFKQSDNTPLNGYRLSVDYTKKLGNGHSLGLGIQPHYFRINGTFDFDTLDVINNIWDSYNYFENTVDFKRAIYAGYVDYNGKIGSKINLIAGLRVEYTDQVLEMENPDYFTIFERTKKASYEIHKLDLFPSIHLSYDITERNKTTFAFSRRISRPPLTNMTPFLYREHFEVYVAGDPALKPEYLTTFELAFNNKGEKYDFNLTGFYRGVNNAVFRVNTVYEEENVLIRSYTNSANTRAAGIEIALNIEAATFARFFLSSSLYNYKVEADIFGYRENNRSTNWNLKGNSNFILTESLKFTLDFDIKSATITAQGRDEMFYMANASLNYTPLKIEGWTFSIKMLDILGSNKTIINTRAYNSNSDQIFFQESEYNRNGPIAELSVSYTFNMKGKSGKKEGSSFGREQF